MPVWFFGGKVAEGFVTQQTEGVLFSVLCDVSRLPLVHIAYERLAMLGIRTLGAVVGGVAQDGYGYRYSSPVSAKNKT